METRPLRAKRDGYDLPLPVGGRTPPKFRVSVSFAHNVQVMATFILVMGAFGSAAASTDFKICCAKAARRNFILYPDTLPWETCGISVNTTPAPGTSPSVNATLGWCKSNCPGHQPSVTGEWLHPITTWLIPYIGLLLLCPTGELGESSHWTQNLWMSKVFFMAMEYASFLGDPASAIWGSFSELAEDWWLSTEARRKTALKRELLAMVILAGQTEFKEGAERKLTNAIILRVLLDMLSHKSADQDTAEIDAIKSGDGDEIKSSATDTASTGILRRRLRIALQKEKENEEDIIPLAKTDGSINGITKALINAVDDEEAADGLNLEQALTVLKEQIAKPKLKKASGRLDEKSITGKITEDQELKDALQAILKDPESATHSKLDRIPQALLREGTFAHRLWEGVRTILEARLDFVSTILVPIVLLFVVTASVFYDAYQSLGDNSTAHSLAYGIFYSWLIILAVASNCFTSSLSTGLVERTIGEIIPLSDTTVRLSERYVNALRWRFWLAKVGVVESQATEPTTSGKIRLLVGQLFGWVCVAIAASCAASISYTTPTVGIGCRSFNFLLYALISLVIALIPVAIYWKEGVGERKTFGTIMIWTKRVLIFCNIIVIVGGTLFHLVGLFRSCWCMNIFVHDSRILELNTNTEQAVANANTYWLSVGYVAFIFIWFVCAAAIIMRQYISLNIGLLQGMNVDDNEFGIRRKAKETYVNHYQAARRALQRKQKGAKKDGAKKVDPGEAAPVIAPTEGSFPPRLGEDSGEGNS